MSAADHPDVFISLRFGEALREGIALKAAMEATDVRTFLCPVKRGDEVMLDVPLSLRRCKMAVIMGTATYGTKTASLYSTHEELQFIIATKKPYFLVKMCDQFTCEMAARLLINSAQDHFTWLPGSPLPIHLVLAITKKLAQGGSYYTFDGKLPPAPAAFLEEMNFKTAAEAIAAMNKAPGDLKV
jgi:hypothetical protein